MDSHLGVSCPPLSNFLCCLLCWGCPPPRLVVVHSWLSFHANTSRGREKERKYATIKIKGLRAMIQLEEVLLVALWGQRTCFQGNSLEQFWLLPPALGVVVPLGYKPVAAGLFFSSGSAECGLC